MEREKEKTTMTKIYTHTRINGLDTLNLFLKDLFTCAI